MLRNLEDEFRVQELASSGKTITETRQELIAQLETVYDNTPKDDWADNLFLGVAYFLLGDKSKGMDTIAVNLDFGYEQKISGMLFAQMEKGALDSSEAQEEIERMKLSELITSMNIADTDSALAMSLYFEGNDEAVVKMAKNSDNPVILHAMRLIEQSKGGAGNYAEVMEYTKRHEALKAKIHGAYSEILPLVKKYADDGRENAQLFMADMMMYGWGVSQDRGKAAEIFARLAERGNVYAQFVMVSSTMMLLSIEAESSAKASNIIMNLRNLKTAALAWYVDHLDDEETLTDLNSERTEILKYINNNDNSGELAKYKFIGNSTKDSWYVFYDSASDITETISQKLADRADRVGLLASNAKTKTGSTESNTYIKAQGAKPYMFIR